MSQSKLTLSSPLYKRFFAWMDERFPIANSIIVIVLYLVCSAVGKFAHQDGEFVLSFADLMGALATWSMFLLLRVFDEHKDYELDVKNYPDRVLQSGLITLTHLKMVGVLAIVLQVCWSLSVDKGVGDATIAWAIMSVWAFLMTVEFFCGEWLEKRLTLYAVSHMAIMPLVIWWILNLSVPGIELETTVIALMALAFFSGFCFEITRKTRGPEEERDSVDSYTKIYGVRGCSGIILTLLTIMASVQIFLVSEIFNGEALISIALIVTFIGLAMLSIFKFLRAPSLDGRENNEKMVGLAMMGGYSVLIGSVIVERGLSLTVF